MSKKKCDDGSSVERNVWNRNYIVHLHGPLKITKPDIDHAIINFPDIKISEVKISRFEADDVLASLVASVSLNATRAPGMLELPLEDDTGSEVERITQESEGPRAAFPVRAEFVLRLLLPKQSRDAILGDLVEEWPENVRKFGVRKARVLYWSDVIKSSWPLLKGRVRDLVVLVFRLGT